MADRVETEGKENAVPFAARDGACPEDLVCRLIRTWTN
jgi:hypothetical protein